jgi:hypothetical protein
VVAGLGLLRSEVIEVAGPDAEKRAAELVVEVAAARAKQP